MAEWNGSTTSGYEREEGCWECSTYAWVQKHKPGCKLDAALTAADLPTQKERDEARAEMKKEPT